MQERITKLEGISIKNFRGIKETTIRGFSDINIFIGRNGSGKSTLLEAIYLASSFVKKIDPFTSKLKIDLITTRRSDRNVQRMVNRDILWYRLATENPIQLTLFFTNGKKMDLELHAQEPEGRLWIHMNKIYEVLGKVRKDYTHFNYSDSMLFNINTGVHGTDISIKNAFFNTFKSEIELLSDTILVDERVLRQPIVMERKVWPKILSKRLDRRIIEIVRQAYEKNAEDLSYIPMDGGYYLVLKLRDTIVRLDDLGDGIRIAIILAAYLLLARNTIVLIEDPENHQHPGGLLSILDFISEIAKNNNLQIFMTTHSLELIRFMRKIAEEKKIGLKVFFFEREKGIVNTRAIETIDLDIIRDLGIDPRFLDVF